jgi:hypothetical protein
MATPRPDNTRTSNVINWGIDKRLPLGFVDVVIDNETGLWVGYMKDGSFYPLGVDAAQFEAQQETALSTPSPQQQARERRKVAINPLNTRLAEYEIEVTTDPNNGQTMLAGKDGIEHFIYVGPDNDIDISTDFDKIRNRILAEVQSRPGSLDALLLSMYNNDLIGKEVLQSKDFSSQEFNKGLLYALRNYGINAVDAVKITGAQKIEAFTDYLKSSEKAVGKATTRTTTDFSFTKRANAADDADRFFMQYLGRGASKEEEDAYYEALRSLEQKNFTSTTRKYDDKGNLISSVSTGDLVNDIDKTLLLGKIAGKAIKGSKVDQLLTAGGQAAGDIQNIMSIANEYGLVMTQQDAMDYVVTNLKKGKNVEQTKNKLIKLAQAKYQNISNLIDDDISVKDIASQYIYDMSQVLELNPQAINVNDPTIQAALLNNNNQGTMSITEFNTMLRKDPRWGKTTNAKNTAASYALEILTSFGLVS